MNNKLKLIILYGSVFIILILIIVVLVFIQRNKKTTTAPVIPTPSPSIKVLETSPIDKASNVQTDSTTTISYALNQPVTITSEDLSVLPQLTYTYEVKNNQILIHPEQNLQPSTLYSITLRIKQPDNTYQFSSFSFTTEGPTPTPLVVDTNDRQVQKDTETYIKNNRPDLLLVNSLPYATSDFSANYQSFSDKPFLITVTLLNADKNAAKQDFITWAESLGLTADQITSLNITYQ